MWSRCWVVCVSQHHCSAVYAVPFSHFYRCETCTDTYQTFDYVPFIRQLVYNLPCKCRWAKKWNIMQVCKVNLTQECSSIDVAGGGVSCLPSTNATFLLLFSIRQRMASDIHTLTYVGASDKIKSECFLLHLFSKLQGTFSNTYIHLWIVARLLVFAHYSSFSISWNP